MSGGSSQSFNIQSTWSRKEKSVKNNVATYSGERERVRERGPEQGDSPGVSCVPQRKTKVGGERIWRLNVPFSLRT